MAEVLAELVRDAGELFSRASVWAGAAGAFLIGSVPFGLLLALLVGKTDVRTAGSGNIGATNVARVVGKKLGILTLVLDATKGALPVIAVLWLSDLLQPPLSPSALGLWASVTGLLAILGHCYTPWLRFKGGKGVATGLGMLVVLRPEVAAYAVLAFAVAFAASRLVSVSSLAAALVAVVALFVRGPADGSLVPILLAFFVIMLRHKENLARLARRSELRL
jgi:glycerol-3-phosphate acyltransferase PlsY